MNARSTNPAEPSAGNELPDAGQPPDPVQLSREELRTLVHELRNGLNSLLMNAGVLAAACRDQPAMGRHIAQIESDGDRCARCLQALSDRHL